MPDESVEREQSGGSASIRVRHVFGEISEINGDNLLDGACFLFW